ncbi:alpha/beta fold hydrolase [Actinokineospora inagensis]|uniref:alpha/beta fold hydrolase n=1 Tax=Actinokineospora inagensis TaxID=103730 RepID=UPI0004289C76|nr:alpha/beta fold hydrolase [Actinokineospora inagensis]
MSNDVDELKQFAWLHAKAQGLTGARTVLDRIRTDDGDAPGAWTGEWSRAADRLRDRGETLAAVGHYTMARFPYVDGEARAQAQRDCADSFAEWAAPRSVERLDLDVDGARVRCWTTGLSARHRRPVLLMCGGIVSVKEQWGPALPAIARLGLAGVVLEMPGVGENPLRYDGDSARLFSAVLDAVADRVDPTACYLLAFSFSGHLALRAALRDHRIRGVVTAGAPVRQFFTDAGWRAALPRVTVDTLAHLTGSPADGLGELMAPWALTDDDLAALDIPVGYAASDRDEIIPPGDPELVRTGIRAVHLVRADDVHGSPRHIAQTRLWAVHTVLRMRGGRPVHRALVGAALRAARLRSRIGSPRRESQRTEVVAG